MLLFISNICFKYCTTINGFKFDFSKTFWGPRLLPRFFSGFAFGSGFALNSWALRALESGFALDSRLANFTWFDPQN